MKTDEHREISRLVEKCKPMIKRIELIIRAQNLSPSQFADRIGIQRSGLSHILSGRNNPSLDFVQKVLSAFPELNPAWFLQGKGRMYVNLAEAETLPFPQEFTPLSTENAPQDLWQEDRPETEFELQSEPVARQAGTETGLQTEIEREVSKEINDSKDNKPKLRRILLFYEDGTFEEYAKR